MEMISSLTEFISYISENCEQDQTLFRGQPMDKSLLPRIARLKLRGNFLEIEQEMLKEFKRQSLTFVESLERTNWDWLALAQHHGLATRLLDWTLNPLVALWFAVEKPHSGQKHGVVWVFEPAKEDFVDPDSQEDPFSGEKTLIFRPRHVTRRIVVQQGWFTVHKYMSKQKSFVPMENIARYKQKVTKLKISVDEFPNIRYDLNRCGINASSIFPDLDGLCRFLQWSYSVDSDES